jgi:hypothetical protein
MKVSQSFELPAHWRRVAQVMCDPEFNCDREKLREGVISCEFRLIEEREHETTFELLATEHRRKRTGGLDRSATVATKTKCRWDATARRMTWEYIGQESKLMSLSGVYRLEPLGDDATRFAHDVTIEVNVPLIGNQIAKLVAKEFERPDDRYPRLWKRYLSR